jgi:hypothetical protein
MPLSHVAVGERVHVERSRSRSEDVARRFAQLTRAGLVCGLTVSLVDRRDDGSTLIRTGRGDVWVVAELCDHLLVTVGDIDRVANELRGRVDTIGDQGARTSEERATSC